MLYKAQLKAKLAIFDTILKPGEVSEWLKEHAWKACMRATVSRVRIPLSPPKLKTLIRGVFNCGALTLFLSCVRYYIYGIAYVTELNSVDCTGRHAYCK